jgi:hypothetical protein
MCGAAPAATGMSCKDKVPEKWSAYLDIRAERFANQLVKLGEAGSLGSRTKRRNCFHEG